MATTTLPSVLPAAPAAVVAAAVVAARGDGPIGVNGGAGGPAASVAGEVVAGPASPEVPAEALALAVEEAVAVAAPLTNAAAAVAAPAALVAGPAAPRHKAGAGYGGGGAGMGGAIFNHGGLLTSINTTFVENAATGGSSTAGSGSGLGAAIFNLNGSVSLIHCTVTGNSVAGSTGYPYTVAAGALYNLGYRRDLILPPAAVTLTNCIVANTSGGSDLVNDCPTILSGDEAFRPNAGAATLTFGGANLIPSHADSGTASVSGPDPLITDPLLGTLADYDGDTWTCPLLPGSPAIDAAAASAVTTDQRGLPRFGAPDLGAFESHGFALSRTGGDNQSTLLGTAFPSPLSVTVTAANPLEPVDGGSVAFSTPATGASATLPSATVTIAGGTASVTATANATLGSYTVAAGTAGAPEIDSTSPTSPRR
ncbi:MAG: hypothetical protein IPL39_21500 [Opitutaceae bacterium]|nr:hypothetical protein [Opitutaceae bacterium]